jgi:sugar/nucleoside kinase (ribokinase family)
MPEQFDAVVAGHICLDLIPEFHKSAKNVLLAPGHLTQVGKAVVSPGGPVANTGLALHKLGIRTKLVGKTGNDLFGSALIEAIDSNGNNLSSAIIRDDRSDTSYTIILSPPKTDRTFFHYPGANDTFSVNDIPLDTVAAAKLFHFGYPPVMRRMYENGGRELAELFRRVKKTGVITSLDMTLPDPATDAGKADWKTILCRTLPYVDIFLPSLEEILFMLRRKEFNHLPKAITPSLLSNIGGELLDYGARIAGIKLGDRGLYLCTAETSELKARENTLLPDVTQWAGCELWAPCFEVDVAGTTGAGDATIAGFLSALLRDRPIEEAVTMAAATGACCVEATDATSGILSWKAIRQRIQNGWKRRPISIADTSWQWHEQKQVWSKL